MATKISNTLQTATQQFEELMNDFFETDPEGNKLELTPEEMENAQATIENAKDAITSTFGPLHAALEAKVQAQGKQIEELKAEIVALRNQPGAQSVSVQVSAAGATGAAGAVIPFPTVAWIAEHHKDHTKSLTNYNIFALYYKSLNGGKAPERGLWEKQPNKEAWKALATQYNTSNKDAAIVQAAGAQAVPQVELSEKIRNSKARSAYQLYVAHWKTLPENKGRSFPEGKGFWAKLPAAERAPFEVQFKALQAFRAVKA
jgi:hypothetical protein